MAQDKSFEAYDDFLFDSYLVDDDLNFDFNTDDREPSDGEDPSCQAFDCVSVICRPGGLE
jgi:hypothetical protein